MGPAGRTHALTLSHSARGANAANSAAYAFPLANASFAQPICTELLLGAEFMISGNYVFK